MKNLEKFADYGLTGTFFLVTQAAFLLLRCPGGGSEGAGFSLAVQLHHALGDLATLSGTPLPQLSPVLGVAAVFFFGLALDLLGHCLVVFEMRTFLRHLDHNRGWVRAVVRLSRGAAREDVETFLCIDCGELFRGGRFYRKLFREFLPPYRRVWSMLVAYITTFCPVSEPEALADTQRLWRVARAVSTTLVILAVELWVASLVVLASCWLTGAGYLVAAITAFAVAVALDRAAFERLCACLFSFGLTTFESRREQARRGAQGPSAPPPAGRGGPP